MKIIFSVVSHNQQDLVQNLLDSMSTYLKNRFHDLIVVITENSLDEINTKSVKFKLEYNINLRQYGFGSNHNRVFEKYESDYFFIINPDIVFKEEFSLDAIIEYLETEKIDISSPKIVNINNCLEDYKRADLTFKNIVKRRIFGVIDDEFHWLAGMFLIVKSDSFRVLKGFDTKFFMYVEDCDLCYRARAAKMKIKEFSDVAVMHHARRKSRKNIRHIKWHVTSLFKYWMSKKLW